MTSFSRATRTVISGSGGDGGGGGNEDNDDDDDDVMMMMIVCFEQCTNKNKRGDASVLFVVCISFSACQRAESVCQVREESARE